MENENKENLKTENKKTENKKTALVTGGSRGIGRAICMKLAESGMNIVFSYHASQDEADTTIQECEKLGAKATGIKADVSDPTQCKNLVEKALKISDGTIDVLVNNAGITKDDLIIKMTDDEYEKVINTNLNGTFYMLREVAKIMLRKRKGRIINISSVVGVVGNAGQVNYAASKAGVIGMTKSLARELASRKITVNAVAPGMIETSMTANIPEKLKSSMIEAIPMRSIGSGEDVANAVLFLASEEASYITGQVLCVDGGMAI